MGYKLTIEVSTPEELLEVANKLNGSVPPTVAVEEPAKPVKKTRSRAKTAKKEEVVATPDAAATIAPEATQAPVEKPTQTQSVADFTNVFQPPKSEAPVVTVESLIAEVQTMVAAAASLTQAQQGEIISSCYTSFGWPMDKKLGNCSVEELSQFIPTFRTALASKGINA